MKKLFLTLTMLLFAFTGVMRASAEQGNVRADQVIEQGFEDGMGDWTMNHCHSSSGPSSAYGGNTGSYAFRFYYTANYPQYLISPELDDNDGVNFTFYAARYSSNYPETFKVGYSSTTNDPTEFTWDSEVTCTTMYGVGAYQEYSYDFPAGTKYVSIACTSNDQFYMFVDDITVTATEPAPAPTPGGIVEVTIGDPTSTTTNSNLPGYSLYEYAISQQIYTADEIGVAGTIETLTMWLKNSSSYARDINVYMTEVEATEFASTTDWVSMSADDMVASFTMQNSIANPIEVAITLATPFEYSGTGNLVICFQDVTGSWSSGLGGVEMAANGNQAIYAYRDGTVYDPSNPGVNGTLLAKKNVIKLSITTGGGGGTSTFATVPDVLDLGYRPNGAWMAPYVFNLKSNVGAVTVNALDFSGDYFTYNVELPATVSGSNPLQVELTTGTAEPGTVNSVVTVLYNGNRDAEQFDVTATAYDPVEGDVYENAIVVSSFPYAADAPEILYKNYDLPVATEGADAVYKLTFANDVLLTAGTTGADAVAALYTEDFAGEDGPMADNNYTYEGPTVNPGPNNTWFNYAYTGTETWYGTSAGGGMMWGYRITPAMLQDLGLSDCSIVAIESAARNSTIATYYDLVIMKGGDTPNIDNMVYYQGYDEFTPGYYFDINLDEPQALGSDENIWIMLYSDSEYAAYCGRYPEDATNGKIWYSTNLSSWYNTTTYTPVLFTHFLTIDGREVVVNLADMKIRESSPANGQMVEAEGEAMGVSRALMAQNRGNRDTDNTIEDMFVPAGTYYCVVASTDGRFPVSIETSEVPAPEQALVLAPMDGDTNVESSAEDPYTAQWIIGDYTIEMQVLFGTEYPPQTALIDWTTELVNSAFLPELEPNQSYFLQVNERNAAGTTMGEIIAFTTPISPVEGFAVAEANLYPGDAAEFTWEANRSLKGYNLYMDGVKVNEEPITENAYAVEDLEYNMTGYNFQVTAVYDAGESQPSETVVVKMTGTATVSGHVYEIDEDHPVANIPVSLLVLDEYQHDQAFEVMTDENGFYTAEILAGPLCMVGVSAVNGEAYGYGAAVYFDPATSLPYFAVDYQGVYENIDIITHEYYYPLGQITATEEENDVLVEWDWTPAEMIVDFESGDFSQAEFTLPATYPWEITTTNPYEGTYCMKSTCEGVASGISSIEVTVEVPMENAKMGFYVRTSCETNYDKFHFYIDGVEQGTALSGENAYTYKEYAVTEGTHTYKWEYAKDSSVNSNDDCVYVDNITMYRQDVPLPPIAGATVYDFEDGSMMGWTSLDADEDGYGWVSSTNPGNYHNAGVNLAGTGHDASQAYVISGSYANGTAMALNPNNYLVSPTQITAAAGAQIQFYACAQDESYAAEHFGVAVSTTSATASDFTTIQEWTMTAKHGPELIAENSRDIRGLRQGQWYLYTVDLSEYAGQDIWVAIRHFNCYDQFILNVDDITLADGSAKPMVRNDRTFQSFNLYRRDIKNVEDPDDAEPELLASLAGDVFEYVDNTWPNLEYGMYQWGIQATYEGYAPEPDATRDVYTYTFDSGLEGWTNIDGDGDGNVWFNSTNSMAYSCYDYSTLGHNGTGCFMISQSYTDCTYDSYEADNYLVSPQKYAIGENASITFWQDWANDTYPDFYEVMVSTAATPSASNFTSVWAVGSKSQGNGAKIRNLNNRYENWTEYTVSLDAYAGQEIWIAFHHEDYDNYELWLDDVTITTGGSSPTPPLPIPTGDGLSDILWSNVIEKDMYAQVTVNVSLNNNQAPTGAVVSFEGPETYTATVDETGTVNFANFRKGDYNLTVTLDGYNNYDETVSITEATRVFDVTLYEQILPVEGLYVSPTGWAKWDGGAAGGTTPVGPVGPTTTWTDDFEDGNLTNWTLIDADGDGDSWNAATPAAYSIGNAHSGTYCASSWSWNSVAFDPDQYMISPLSEGATSINYFVATNTAYADHYGIVASSTGTNASDFTVVFEETAGSKGGNGNGGAKTSMTLNGGNREMSDWIEKTVELPAGTKYVGFRHWNSSDMNYLFIDDVTITMGGAKGDRAALSYKVKLDGAYEGETPNTYFQHNVEGFEAGSEHITEVAAVYATGMGDWVAYNWIYTPCSEYNGVTNYAAAVEGNNVNLSWTLGGTPTPPTPVPGTTYNFDDGLQGWTTIDGGSPTGYGWHQGSNTLGTGNGHNGSTDLVISQSYDNNYGVIYPNNFLISPAKGQYSSISLWACGQDANYASEHFGVAVSTGGNTSASDFTMVQEWTIGSKGDRYAGPRGNRDQSTWTEYTVDLSAYAGQDIWVAVRHFNCSDMFYLDVDDITLNGVSKSNRAVVYEPHFVTDPGAMANGADASWTKNGNSTWGPNINNASGYMLADDFTLTSATTITEIEAYGYQTGSTTTSTFTGLYATIYDAAPNAGGSVVWGDMATNIMTATSFTNCYRGSDGEVNATTRPIMAVTASGLNIELPAGTYYLVWSLAGTASSGPWAAPEALPNVGNTGDGLQYSSSSGWAPLMDSGSNTPYGGAFKLVGEGGTPGPVPPTPGDVLGVYVYRDGELVSGTTPLTANTYTDSNVEAGQHEYCVRVVYSDYAMSCPQCETVNVEGVTCDPVTNLTATQTEHPDYGMGVLLEWEGQANSYKVYQGAELLGSISGTSVFIYNIGDGEYTFGVVAVYTNPACESEMVTVTIVYDAIAENDVVNNLYPNPTNGKVTIEAQGMNHITVANTLGQVVYDADVDADMFELNLGQYNAGLYLVRVSTVNGVSVKRVTVVK